MLPNQSIEHKPFRGRINRNRSGWNGPFMSLFRMPAPVAILQTEQCPTWKDTKRTESAFHSHSFARVWCVGVCLSIFFNFFSLTKLSCDMRFFAHYSCCSRYRCSVQCIEITLIVADKSSLINNRAKKQELKNWMHTADDSEIKVRFHVLQPSSLSLSLSFTYSFSL